MFPNSFFDSVSYLLFNNRGRTEDGVWQQNLHAVKIILFKKIYINAMDQDISDQSITGIKNKRDYGF